MIGNEMLVQAETIHRFGIIVHFKRLTTPTEITHLVELIMSEIIWDCKSGESRPIGILACQTTAEDRNISVKVVKHDGRIEISGAVKHTTNKIYIDIDLNIPGFPDSLYSDLIGHAFEHFIPQIGYFEIKEEGQTIRSMFEGRTNSRSQPVNVV